MSKKQEQYEALQYSSVNTMNYLFLRFLTSKIFHPYVGESKEQMMAVADAQVRAMVETLIDELQVFLTNLSLLETLPEELYGLIKAEMEEGYYLEDLSYDEFAERVSMVSSYILGEVDENIYNLYTAIAGEILEEETE